MVKAASIFVEKPTEEMRHLKVWKVRYILWEEWWSKKEKKLQRTKEVRYRSSKENASGANVSYTRSIRGREEREIDRECMEETESFYDSSAAVSPKLQRNKADFHDSIMCPDAICASGSLRRHILMRAVKWTSKQFPPGASKSRPLRFYSNTRDIAFWRLWECARLAPQQ